MRIFVRDFIRIHETNYLDTERFIKTWNEFVYLDIFDMEFIKRLVIIRSIEWDKWVNNTGLAPVPLDFTISEKQRAAHLAGQYI